MGAWLWTCRAGFEPFLYEELAWQSAGPRLLGAALVESAKRPRELPAFARAGFPIQALVDDRAKLTERVGALRRPAREGDVTALHVWAPDTDEGNRGAALRDALVGALSQPGSPAQVESGREALARGGRLVEVCEVGREHWAVGSVPAREAASLSPGGKSRMRRGAEAPSRAAMKLDEALEGVGLPPGRGDVCVDLGAAPGGWTARLVARGARVIAVDPARLSPELTGHPKVTHVQQSAFAYAPEEPVDWLLCDMAWRPLEVAQLLAKWARRRWALQLCANIKLPMKDKLPIIHRVRHTLESGGWQPLRVRQLYHDRDEVTVLAGRGG